MKTMTGFDTEDVRFDSVRYVRALRGIVKWKNAGARNTLMYGTGVGKSTSAMIIIAKMMKMKNLLYDNSILLVVPTTKLKKQWRKNLKAIGFGHVEVEVINTVSLKKGFTRTVDLLIIDEIHLAAADKFQRVFQRVKSSWTAGLTATLDRLDGKHIIIERHCPVCDIITQKEAIERGWVSDIMIFNLAVTITRAEAEAQVVMGKQIAYYMSRFGDFYKMLSCMNRENASLYAQQIGQTPEKVMQWATQGMRNVHKRKEFLDTTEHKIKVAVELVKEFGVRTILFSQSTAFADIVSDRLGDNCVTYHSMMKPEMRKVIKTKSYKTISSADKFILKLTNQGYKPTPSFNGSEYIITWEVVKSFSGSKIADENIDRFEKAEVDWLAAAKAVDQGYDDPTIRLGVDSSRSENPAQAQQRIGRTGRVYLDEQGKVVPKCYVYLYVPEWNVTNSRDEKKLRLCQKNIDNVIDVDSIEELKEMLRAILKKRGHESL